MNRVRVLLHVATQAWSLRPAAAGAVAAVFLIGVVAPFRVAFGTDWRVDAAIALVMAVGTFSAAFVRPGTFTAAVALPLVGLWALWSPRVIEQLQSLFGWLSPESLETTLLALLIGLSTLVCLGPVLVGCLMSYRSAARQDRRSAWLWGGGFCLSLLVLPAMALPYSGLRLWVAIALAAGVLLLFLEIWRAARRRADLAPSPAPAAGKLSGGGWAGGLALIIGGALAVASSVSHQLISRSLSTDFALLAGFMAGIVIASRRENLNADRPALPQVTRVGLACAAWMGLLVAGYPMWTSCCLWISTWVSNVMILQGLRSALLGAMVLPGGFLAGLLMGGRDRCEIFASRSQIALPLLVAGGYAGALGVSWSPALAAAIVMITALCLAVAAWGAARFPLPVGRWQNAGALGLLGSGLAGLLLVANLSPKTSEKILFSTSSLQLFRQGVSQARLGWMDDGREIASFESLSGRCSVWRYRGAQLITRRDGITTEMRTSDPGLDPRSVSDLLPALLPLAFHPDAEHVLVLGAHPAAVETCHAWPLQSVTVTEGERAAWRMLEWLRSSPMAGFHLQGGPEFVYRHVDPAVALLSRHPRRYDVIIAPLAHPVSVTTANLLSRECCQRIFALLDAGGLFAQRLPYYDLGPDVTRSIIATLQAVFPEVLLIESVPGELIFLCARDRVPPLDAMLVDRLQSPQCRRLLGEAGWDWSVILGRGGLTDGSLREFVGAEVPVSTLADPRLAFALPVEVPRWGDKANATRDALGQHGQALRNQLGEGPEALEVTQRLEDLSLAHQIQKEHPNEPWAYRTALKERLKDRPRSTILPVKHEGLKRVLHPEDQRRKDYLLALGQAARQPQPPLDDILRLAAYEAPFDPLVSLYVHYEIAELLGRCATPSSEEQFRHLVHTAYFASGQDSSVRNVSEAIHLICRHQEVGGDAADRWDHVNGLLQVLSQRWQFRLSTSASSSFEPIDTDHSIGAVEQGMRLLKSTYPAAGLTAAEWSARESVIEELLLRPLQRHRSEQLRHGPALSSQARADASREPIR